MKNQKINYWLIADTHFGHGLMLTPEIGRPRDFAERTVQSLQRTVRDGDIVLHLGDVCLGHDKKWHEWFCSEVPGIKWLVLGNHDRKSTNWYLARGWSFVGSILIWRAFGHVICFSHCPVPVGEVYYTLNVHGHSHGDGHRAKDAGVLRAKNPNQILIAMELTNYQPVNLDSLMQGRRSATQLAYRKDWLDGENRMKKIFAAEARVSTAMSDWKKRDAKRPKIPE